ncbi:HD domain-containing protein [Photobacterium sp. SDRW27]|uniref:HD-GYP domain-containing protein n=1 Tax=Photobacterium obscurum TaxID=2829490 RepID=UPI0022433211|nr:HD domain-containing phosphohydrolase [Photobacterium obscurum]MCW8329764.1 HD domain-containing protein [Photobacterium obscurum]
MNTEKQLTRRTGLHYILAAGIFSLYGGRVCPFLDTLSGWQASLYASLTFFLMFALRTAWGKNGEDGHFTLKNLVVFVLGAIGLSAWYSYYHHFPAESLLKVLLGIGSLGVLISLDLSLFRQILHYPTQIKMTNLTVLQRYRHSIAFQMAAMVLFVVALLTTILGMIVLKDVRWMAENITVYGSEAAIVSIVKEFVFVAVVLVGYTVSIMYQWLKLMRMLLASQQQVLEKAASGNLSVRVPVVQHGEMGVIAHYTNEMLGRLEKSYEEVNLTRDVAIVGLSALAESRDNETGAHILRTQEYVRALANKLKQQAEYRGYLTEERVELLYKSAPLHDIGKVGIPDAILLKPGKLTDEEFETMKNHTVIGAQSIATAENQMGSCSFLSLAREIALTHHEKWDGSGYPRGLAGEQIPLSGRLMALADVYDALISKRVYKPAFSHEKAKSIIFEGNGTHFDPLVVKAFLACESEFVQIASTYQDEEALVA